MITGASSGIGLALAKRFAEAGIEVGILAEQPSQVEAAVAAIRSTGGKAFPVHVDLSRREQFDGLIDRIEAEHGPLDVLVNNAGIGLQARALEIRETDMRLLFEVNFFAMVILSRDAFRHMSTRGCGHIINISSAAARRALPGLDIYASTKAAMHAFSQSLRVQAQPVGIAVTEVLPMSVRTSFFQNAVNRSENDYNARNFLTTPEGLAERVLRALRRPVPEINIGPYSRLAQLLDVINPRWMDSILIRRHLKTLRDIADAERRAAQSPVME